MLQGKDKEHFEPRKNETNNWKYAQLSPYNVFLRKKMFRKKKWTEDLLVLEISTLYHEILFLVGAFE